MSAKKSLMATIVGMQREVADSEAIYEMLLSHVLAPDANPDVTEHLMYAYLAAIEEEVENGARRDQRKVDGSGGAWDLMVEAFTEGFRSVLDEGGDPTAAFDMPSSLPQSSNTVYPLKLIEEAGFIQGADTARETKEWYKYAAAHGG